MKNYLKIIGAGVFFYIFFVYFTPYIAQYVPAWSYYVNVCNERNIEPGALYYSDLPMIYETEAANREAVIDAYGSMTGFMPVKDNK